MHVMPPPPPVWLTFPQIVASCTITPSGSVETRLPPILTGLFSVACSADGSSKHGKLAAKHPRSAVAPLWIITLPSTVRVDAGEPGWLNVSPNVASNTEPAVTVRFPFTSAGPPMTAHAPLICTLPMCVPERTPTWFGKSFRLPLHVSVPSAAVESVAVAVPVVACFDSVESVRLWWSRSPADAPLTTRAASRNANTSARPTRPALYRRITPPPLSTACLLGRLYGRWSRGSRVGREPRDAGDRAGDEQPAQRPPLQVPVEERRRRARDDPLVAEVGRVRRPVARAEEPQQELGPVHQREVRGGGPRAVEGVARPLHREERRRTGRGAGEAGKRRPRHDDGGVDARVAVARVVRRLERGDAAVRVPGDRDLARVDEPAERPRRRGEPRDDEADVAGLVRQVCPVGAAASVGVLDGKRRRSDDVARARPGVEEPRVRARRQRETVREDDERKRGAAAARVAHVRHEHARARGAVLEAREACPVDQSQHAHAHGRRLPASSPERDGYRSRHAPVDGEEVAVVGHEVPRRRLLVVRNDLRRLEAVAVRVRDQRRPFGVDVELHRTHRARPLEDLRERRDGLVIGGRVDQVAAAVDPRDRKSTRLN